MLIMHNNICTYVYEPLKKVELGYCELTQFGILCIISRFNLHFRGGEGVCVINTGIYMIQHRVSL